MKTALHPYAAALTPNEATAARLGLELQTTMNPANETEGAR